ncbi:unnamed protein product [Clonostachys rosea]|uniref:Cytochrome P450 n=1 Tax=Bionectria ochroleuca TaxID=29856 RepID=A0ABY6TXJ3_BIOOC|nr:unnamed protein product [Clonostachys rosea]
MPNITVNERPIVPFDGSPWIWSGLLLLPLAAVLLRNAFFSKRLPVPVIYSEVKDTQARKSKYLQFPRETLGHGYKTFGSAIWGLDTSQGIKLVIPTTYLDELKSHPSLSFTESISNDAMKEYTGVGGLPDNIVQIFKAKFNPTVAAYLPYLQETVEKELADIFPYEQDWTETSVYHKVTRLVGRVSTRAFYGEAASRDEAWLELAQAYIETVLEYLQALKPWPEALRPVARFFLPQRAKLLKQWNQAHRHLSATLVARAASNSRNDPPSVIDHIIDSNPHVKVDELIHTQMALVVAGIHTTSAALTQLLFDMAAHPEQSRELRDEVDGVFDGHWTKQSLDQLKKLDSWMKESQRMNSADLTTFQRQALKPLRLTSGLSIDKGTRLEIPTAAIHFDDMYFSNASKFEPLRFYEMRKEEPAKHQYISTGKNDLAWGYGRHACPGRFFAHVEMKIFMAEFVRRWDVKMKDGLPRHRNLEFEANVSV